MSSSALDQGFRAYGARLLTGAGPYDPFAKTGGPDDSASYLARPGVDFLRPWLAIENDVAFQWPLGVEGFTFATDPLTGEHKLIGDNKVTINIVNTGAETLNLSGSFPGDSSPALMQALREVVRRSTTKGKILFVPELMTHAQRVQVSHAEWGHGQDARDRTITYTIDFFIVGVADVNTPPFTVGPSKSTAPPRGKSGRTVKTDSAHNTLQKVAAWKLGSASKWLQVYELSEAWFVNNSIPKSQAPSYRLPLGTTLYY